MATFRHGRAHITLAAAALLIIGTAHGVSARPTRADTWVEDPPMLLGRGMHEMARLCDGRVLVPGGLNGHFAGATVPVAEVYDPRTRQWSTTAPMLSFHSKHTATTLHDGRVLVAGGEGRLATVRGNPLTMSEVYDPAADSWTPTGPMISEVPFNHSAVLLDDGRVLVAGGRWSGTTAAGVLNTTQLYDPTTNRWSETSEMRHARAYHASALLPDGRVLVAGGEDERGDSMTSAEVWDPATGSWSEVGSLLVPHHNETNSAVTLRSGRVLLAGGSNSRAEGSGILSDATQVFDPRTNTWALGQRLPEGRNDHLVIAVADGRVLVAGGQIWRDETSPPNPTSTVATASTAIYDPRHGSWSNGPSMHAARANAAAVTLDDGTVFVTGGIHLAVDGAYLAEQRVERFTSTATIPGPRRGHLSRAGADRGCSVQ